MSNLHYQPGDLVRFDCPNSPLNHGRKARVVGPAGINGPDWFELELVDEFFLIPDTDRPGHYFKTSQVFASASILKPIADAGQTPEGPPFDESFYIVNSRGIIFGPPMKIDRARERVSEMNRSDGPEIVPAWMLIDILAKVLETD
jgi:hypothetical protein